MGILQRISADASRMLIVALASAVPVSVASSTPTGSPANIELKEVLNLPTAKDNATRHIVTRGTVYALAPRSIFLVFDRHRMADKAHGPLPNECVQALASTSQYEILRTYNRKVVTIDGELHYVSLGSGILMSVTVRGRSTHPYCQYGSDRMPVIFINKIISPGRSRR